MTLSEVFAYIQSWGSVTEKKLIAEFGFGVVNELQHLFDLKLVYRIFRGDAWSVSYREVVHERW